MEAELLVKDLLQRLDLGSSVAENDALLERYFVETESFRALVEGRADVVAGDKGAGKSALYKILSERYSQYSELSDVEVISAFNPVGTPVFQRLNDGEVLPETAYINIWKAYFFALGGNWVLQFVDGDYTEQTKSLHDLLQRTGLRSSDDSARSVFSKLINRLKKMLNISSAEASGNLGIAEITARIDFFSDVADPDPGTTFDEALRLLNSVLEEMEIRFWLAVDRLDEAFQGRPELERVALRALLRTFLDMQEFDRLRIKLFVRRDLFRRITSGGFVNLTHVNARKIEISWDEADLQSLLHKRLVENESFIRDLGAQGLSANDLFYTLFPQQVDPGTRRPTTWTWIMGRIEDANRVRPPRNLIDLILKAREAQLRREDREPRERSESAPLIGSDAIKRGQLALSTERVEDTLLAEAGNYSDMIEKFRDGKAEHNSETLRRLLGDDYMEAVKFLQSIGFIEQIGSSYKIPMLYRGGLGITQGRAFDAQDAQDER